MDIIFFNIKYNTELGNFKVKTEGEILVIIDYGRSTIKYGDEEFIRFKKYTNCIYDVINLLINLSYLCNTEIFDYIYELLIFFINVDKSILKERNFKTLRYLDENNKFKNSINNYILYCIDFCKKYELNIFEEINIY